MSSLFDVTFYNIYQAYKQQNRFFMFLCQPCFFHALLFHLYLWRLSYSYLTQCSWCMFPFQIPTISSFMHYIFILGHSRYKSISDPPPLVILINPDLPTILPSPFSLATFLSQQMLILPEISWEAERRSTAYEEDGKKRNLLLIKGGRCKSLVNLTKVHSIVESVFHFVSFMYCVLIWQ